MSIADYLIQMGPKTPNPTADALERWAATQAPQLTPNYARSAQQASLQTGGPFAGLVSGILGFKAASTDAKNAQALQQQSAQQDLATRLMNWGREDEVAQRNRNWSKADQLEAWSRQHQKDLWERENKTADKLEAWARENEAEQRKRDWALADRQAAWEREDEQQKAAAQAALSKQEQAQAQEQNALAQSQAVAQRGLEELQGIADRNNIGAATRWRNSKGLIGKETRQDLGKISGAIAAVAPMAISKLKEAGVSGINSLQEFMTYIGLPDNPTSQEIAGALPIIRNTLGFTQTGPNAGVEDYNKKYGL